MGKALVILAAGTGSRYGGLKQLAPIGPSGETLLEYAAWDASRAGFDHIILVVRHETVSAFREKVDSGMGRSLRVSYAFQSLRGIPDGCSLPEDRTKPWGTGQAILAAGPHIDGPFAVVNADDFYGLGSYRAVGAFLDRLSPTDDSVHLAAVGYRLAETLSDVGAVSRAILRIDDHGRLQDVVEHLEIWRETGSIRSRDRGGSIGHFEGNELVSMNMWGVGEGLLPQLQEHFAEFLSRQHRGGTDEFIFPDVVQALMREGQAIVDVLPGSGEWCGVTFEEDQGRVRDRILGLIREGKYPEDLWAVGAS